MYDNYAFRHNTWSVREQQSKEVKTNGEGTIKVKPDKISITVGVITSGNNIQTVQSENTMKMNGILQALRNLGLFQEKIRTSDYTINLLYDYENGKSIPKGYEVKNLLNLDIDDIARSGVIIETAITHGANYVSNLQFSISNQKTLYHQALAQATLEAKKKASTIANALGVSINPIPVKVNEIISSPLYHYAFAEQASSLPGATPVQIEPGESTINASVEAVFTVVLH